MKNTMSIGGSERLVINTFSMLGMPVMIKTAEKQLAPNRIHMTMPVVVNVRLAASASIFQLKRLYTSEAMIAPNAPTAADSVGDAIPRKMLPINFPKTL